MTIRKIAQMGEPVLRRRADEVPPERIETAEVQNLIDDMIETMRDADGAGIAAPQVYASLRICVLETDGNPRYPDAPEIPLAVLINPVVTPLVPIHPLDDQHAIEMYEGCLSVAGIRGKVRRPRKVHFRALNRSGQLVEGECEGFSASVIQHETDHLDGVLFVDRADAQTLCFLREFGRYVPVESRIVDGAD